MCPVSSTTVACSTTSCTCFLKTNRPWSSELGDCGEIDPGVASGSCAVTGAAVVLGGRPIGSSYPGGGVAGFCCCGWVFWAKPGAARAPATIRAMVLTTERRKQILPDNMDTPPAALRCQLRATRRISYFLQPAGICRNTGAPSASSATVNNVELVKKAFIFRGINWKTLHEPVLDSFNQVIYSQRYGSLASSVLVDSAKSKTGPELVEFLRRWKVLRILIADDHEVAPRGRRAVLWSD